jgi:hypothetical protein
LENSVDKNRVANAVLEGYQAWNGPGVEMSSEHMKRFIGYGMYLHTPEDLRVDIGPILDLAHLIGGQ